MSRKKFGQLLHKYLRGECTPQEKLFVEHWYGLLETETDESSQELDSTELEARLWNQIQQKMDNNELPDRGRIIPFKSFSYRWAGIAASLLLIGIWFYTKQPSSNLNSTQSLTANWIERSNTSNRPLAVRLEDGSTVQLAAHSSLRFPKHFDAGERTVYLTGDAFFSIQKMPSRPFYVHTNEVTTKVLGTSFFVRTQVSAKQVRVEVVTGQVAVYKQPEGKKAATNGVVLSPNQATTFFGDKQQFVTGLVDNPQLLQSAEGVTFRFDDSPLSDVLSQLEKAYGINIDVKNAQLTKCPLTADLTNQPLNTQLAIICAALKATYTTQGTTILLSGKGCGQ